MKEPVLVIIILIVIFGFAYKPMQNSASRKSAGTGGPAASTIGDKNPLEPLSNKEITEQIKKIEKEINKFGKDFGKGVSEAVRSPYYGKIDMSNISGVRRNDPSKEYFTLNTKLAKNETLNITGWYFKSSVTGYFAMIGRAAVLPFPFTKTEQDIVLQYKDRVYVVKGFSPIGISFRTNKCTGFFEENRTFYPSLSRQCPLPEDEKLPRFSTDLDRDEECREIIEDIPRCTTVGNEFIRDLPDTVPYSCKVYMTTQINYNTCVAKHFGDTDFPGNQYRVYLNKFGPLWREKNETITLYDQNGLPVDSISY